MENNYFKKESPKKGILFLVALGAILLFAAMGAGIDMDEFLQFKGNDIPTWYFYIIFAVDVVILLSIILIYFYKKMGVIIFPIASLLHFFFHLYYLDTFLYSDITSLFLFVGVGLLAVIPKWQFFK